MVNAKLIRWRETEVICQETEVKHYEIESKSLSISNRENDVGNVMSLTEMKSFVLPAKKGIERLVGGKIRLGETNICRVAQPVDRLIQQTATKCRTKGRGLRPAAVELKS